MIRAATIACALWCAAVIPASATGSPADIALDAAGKLESAAEALEQASGARNRVAALTKTIQAYEQGLSALRAGLRQASLREKELRASFEAKRDEVERLVGVMGSMGRTPAPLLMLHPSGPLGTARSGMLLTEITPSLHAEAEALRRDLEEIVLLRSVQEDAVQILSDGLSGVQDARLQLSQAVAERTDLPHRFDADPARMQALLDTASTLDAFAKGLAKLELQNVIPSGTDADFVAQKGSLRLPVNATLLRGFKEADAAGIARPGILMATFPGALLTNPAPATIRYVGPLLDYGNVMVLEPEDNILVVLGGLSTVYGVEGEVLDAGAPLGLMGGTEAASDEFLSDAPDSGGAERSETLYMEIRMGEGPVDPTEWFAMTSQ